MLSGPPGIDILCKVLCKGKALRKVLCIRDGYSGYTPGRFSHGECEMRPSGRAADGLREIQITRRYTKYGEGSVLVEFGETRVVCTASLDRTIPRWLKGTGQGWITAEYGMLPRSTGERNGREAARGRQSGRTLEIQRLIGRSLRAAVNLKKLGDNTITLDCDVIQADGGTRTAAITGACVALVDCLRHMQSRRIISHDPLIGLVAAVSVGIYNGNPVLDLDYAEDSSAETDMNLVMTEKGGLIEVQGTAETAPFSKDELMSLLDLGETGLKHLFSLQRAALDKNA